MAKAAREHKVITQLGNQGHSADDIRLFCEWIWDGAIGNVTEIHAGCDALKALYCRIHNLPSLTENHEIPAELDWDLWLGPSGCRKFHPTYLPFQWRGWMPFSTGCIGDWICHIVDPSMWALDLGAPSTVRTEVDGDYDPEKHGDFYPSASTVTFQFPARNDRGPVKLVWHDSNSRIPHTELLSDEQKVPGVGAIVYGDKGASCTALTAREIVTFFPSPWAGIVPRRSRAFRASGTISRTGWKPFETGARQVRILITVVH